MKNFEEAVSEYLVKVVNQDNPAIYTYLWRTPVKSERICLKRTRNGRQALVMPERAGRRIRSPDGVEYPTILAASQATGISYYNVRMQAFKRIGGWSFV